MARGKGTNRGDAPNPQGHRGPIQVWIALRRCSDPGRAAMRPIPFLAWQPARPPFGRITRSHYTSFQRPLDTRRHRVNKIEGRRANPPSHPHHHRTPRRPSPCPVGLNRTTTSGRTEQHAFYSLPTGASAGHRVYLHVQALPMGSTRGWRTMVPCNVPNAPHTPFWVWSISGRSLHRCRFDPSAVGGTFSEG